MKIEEAYNTIKKSVEAINTRTYATKAEYEKVECIKVLLTAYEKEKETVDKINKLNIPVDTLIAEFERLEDLEDDLTTVYLNGVYDGEKKVEDKIKAKIEESEKQQKEEPDAYLCIKVLQSLLEKE